MYVRKSQHITSCIDNNFIRFVNFKIFIYLSLYLSWFNQRIHLNFYHCKIINWPLNKSRIQILLFFAFVLNGPDNVDVNGSLCDIILNYVLYNCLKMMIVNKKRTNFGRKNVFQVIDLGIDFSDFITKSVNISHFYFSTKN